MTSTWLEYIPKGGMCAVCVHAGDDCSRLSFEEMPRLGKGDQDGTVIVRCTVFVPEETERHIRWEITKDIT